MKVVIPGGSGQVGTMLARAFHAKGYEVVVLSRRPDVAPWRTVAWDGRTLGDWASELEAADAVINLAGRSVNCRYTRRNRREIMNSRTESTRVIGQAIARAKVPPRVWLQASTATLYAHRYDADNDEATGIVGGCEPSAPSTWKFSIDVATAWEQTFNDAMTTATRKVLLRSAMTMSPDAGGVFDTLLRLVRFGLGGRCGDGRQFVSWIHEDDFVAAVDFLIAHEDLSGAFNLSSPRPLEYRGFMQRLRAAWGIRLGLPAPKWLLEVGTFFMRSESELVLKSRRVIPRRLLDAGFSFQFPDWEHAAGDLCEQWRLLQRGVSAQRSREPARNRLEALPADDRGRL